MTLSPARSLPTDWHGTATVPIDADQVFNGYVAANVVFALDRLGVWARLVEGPLRVTAFAGDLHVDERMFRELLRAAATFGYLTGDADTVRLTPAGVEMAAMRGYFTWAVGGYNEVFAGAAGITAGDRRFGVDIHRDEAMVATGSAQNDGSFMARILDDVLGELNFDVLADLGSGVSARVCRVLGDRAGARGLGLDISGPATQLAQQTIGQAGLTGRVEAIQCNVLDVVLRQEHRAALAEVDTVMSFFLMHDLLADPASRSQVLPRMREAFPAATTFVLADTMLRPAQDESSLPIFSTGYELAHALMGVPLHTRDEYETLFAAAGLRPRRVEAFGTPHSWLYVLDAE
ncbi:type 12 methyltransferase [Actinoplanes sp. SE50]|uniref:class I SAM-dependent methyltransferase n=1 Tax=unclassified Actinoplanes TaxID=2626549 RepID=UPI00023EC873|nr:MULTISPECIES: class I SAM-dependent methyltransferase [unclassified Actinoplanes]AEV87081.1 methyltransferase type 12 [Actinoplanes sp. SE50/110]ATO85479.1 type 12 methyltransferase [Actinoplanes sp. SE50]SLM02891.1 methyltransferase domain containing protein [Actinoplanes sp. SE50/110]